MDAGDDDRGALGEVGSVGEPYGIADPHLAAPVDHGLAHRPARADHRLRWHVERGAAIAARFHAAIDEIAAETAYRRRGCEIASWPSSTIPVVAATAVTAA